MKQLIRFEDAYGMADLVCIAHDLGLINLYSRDNALVGVQKVNESKKKGIYIECGLTFPAVLLGTNELIGSINKYKIDELILIYDMDKVSKGNKILSSKEIETYLKNLRQFLDSHNCNNVSIKAVPIVWAAETLVLYILIHDFEYKEHLEFIEPTKLVHKLNTAKFHSEIISEVLKKRINTNIKIKHIRDYIEQDEIINGLVDTLNQFPKSINKRVIEWVITLNGKYLFDINETVKHQIDIENFYAYNQPKAGEIFEVYGRQLDFNKKCW